MDDATSFQRVVELFLLRYHGRMIADRMEVDNRLREERERDYRMLLAYGLDPEFRIALSEEMEGDDTMRQWREELGFVLALEIVLSKNGRVLFERIISKERLEELERAYPEVFAKSAGDMPSSIEELLSSTCGPEENSDPALLPLTDAVESLFPEGFELPNAMRALHRHGKFLNLEPGWMLDLEKFRGSLSSDVQRLLEKLGDRPEIDPYQAKRVQGRNASVELIFCIANEAALIRWFTSLDDEGKGRVLASTTELGWNEEGMAKAMEWRFEWSDDPVQGSRAIMDAAESYRQYGEIDAALFIYHALVGDARVKERELAEVHNRMAVIHREEGRQHQAFLEFQEAGIIWEGLGAMWESAVTDAFVAEGYHLEGKNEKAEKYLEEAFERLEQSNEKEEKMARGYYYLAACANGLSRLDLERKALKKGLGFAQCLDDGELFTELNDRLIDLPK
ncbi:MAG: hypothetical protein LUQ39_09590 [Methanomassiliicoccales archaeon]|nr:hypothetical protein [Methanomassiliicoccales archaeon]